MDGLTMKAIAIAAAYSLAIVVVSLLAGCAESKYLLKCSIDQNASCN